MNRAMKLLPVSFSLTSVTAPSSSLIRFLSTKDNDPEPPSNLKTNRDLLILEQFKRRQQKGSVKANQFQSKPSKIASSSARVREKEKKDGPSLVSGFEGLGLREELTAAAEEMGFGTPTEIQYVGIPAVLDGKSVVLSSDSGAARTLSYLLPLVQLLTRDEASVNMKPKHPRAIVLCTTEKLSDECFHLAKFIGDHARSNSSMNHSGAKSNTPIGMLVGTPGEIYEQIEEGNAFCDDINYLVLDEADMMLSHDFGPTVQKIISQIRDRSRIQSILVTSPILELLNKKLYPVMECLGNNHAGEVAAILLEMNGTEAFDLLKSADALMKKLAEAMHSLHVDSHLA